MKKIKYKPQAKSVILMLLLSCALTVLFSQNNEYFYRQWGLKNDGTYPYYAVPGIDINAVEAWKITKGSPEIRIAILDEWVQTDHPNIEKNILDELSYEPPYNPPVLEEEKAFRCTFWAGIIAAADDYEPGIVGVAPNCKIVPITIGLDIKEANKIVSWSNDNDLSDGIRYAWETAKADIIVIPWGGNNPNWNNVDAELLNAVTLGRDGKGCVIVAAAGQKTKFQFTTEGPSPVNWPANLPFVMGVGALYPHGVYPTYVNFAGNLIDVVAPGEVIWTTKYEDDYVQKPERIPDGLDCSTEAACSFVAGVAALMLSANPCLLQDEVRKIIALSCRKTNRMYNWYNYTFFPSRKYGAWNNRMGYGLPDAYKSILYALNPPETFDVAGVVTDVSDPVMLTINNNWYWEGENQFALPPYAVVNGDYEVKRHEVTATVRYNFPLPPLVQGIANGFSAELQNNNGRCFMEVVNATETEATVRTYVYEFIGSPRASWIPAHPDEVRFHIAVMNDNFHNEMFLQNEVETTTQNYTSLTTIAAGKNVTAAKPIGDYVIQSGGRVSLHAGESILLSDGFHAALGSFFKTHIEPFFICDDKALAQIEIGDNESLYVINNYAVEKTYEVGVIEGDYYLKLYPNPSAGEVTIEYNINRAEIVEISLHDNFGKLVYKLNNRAPHEAGVYKITLSGVELPNGTYYCTLQTETGKKTEKLLIMR